MLKGRPAENPPGAPPILEQYKGGNALGLELLGA